MARKGENIYKRKDGRWEARYEKGRNSKGQIIYGSLYGKSYREVREKKINSIVKLPVAKTISPSESMNICDVSTRWLESIRHTVKESTYSCYLTLIQKHILTYFNNSSMITSEHIQQFINYKITNDLSPTSVRNIVVLLERILRYGEDENLLPVTKRSFTFPKSSFYINDTLDVSQLSILARYLYLEGDAFSVGLLLCMHTGIRIGEVLGLKWEDCDFERRKITINKTIHYSKASSPVEGSKFFYTTAKTISSNRVIPMTDEVYEILQNQKIKQTEQKMWKRSIWKQHKEFQNLVFTCSDGSPVYYYNVNSAIKDYVAKINVIEIELAKEEKREPKIFELFTCHTLRHTYATRCYENGVDQQVVQKLLGHSTLAMTTDLYTHVSEEKKKEEVAELKILA